MTIPISKPASKTPPISHKQVSGGDPVSRHEAGLSAPHDHVNQISANLEGSVFVFKNQKTAREMYSRSCQQTHAEHGPDGLIRLVPNELPEGSEFLGYINGTCVSGSRAVDGKELQLSRSNFVLFIRLKPGSGTEQEERLLAGDMMIDSDELFSLAELETPGRTTQSAVEWLMDYNTQQRAAWKKHLDSQPKPIDPKADFAAAVGAGVVEALKAMGLAPKAATQAKP